MIREMCSAIVVGGALVLTGCGGDDNGGGGGGHDHDEVSIGFAQVGDMEVDCLQGHGMVEPGKECHLAVKLPYSDDGQSIVRVWIGTEDRDQSVVALAEYSASHDDYDAHVQAPDPLPARCHWWIEVEKPDGTVSVGSTEVLRDG